MFSVLRCTMLQSRSFFGMSSIPPVVSMSTYSLMEPFWLLEGVRRPFRCVLPLPNMEPRRQEFCGPYQQARQVGGRPMCSYTSRSCPFGRHACRTCGRVGHGAEDCQMGTPQTDAEPPSVPAAVPKVRPKAAAILQPPSPARAKGGDPEYGD